MTAIKLLDNLTNPLNYDKRMRPANTSQIDSPLSVNVSIYVVALGSLDSSSSVYYIHLTIALCQKNDGTTLTIRPISCLYCVCLYSSEDLEGNLCLPSFFLVMQKHQLCHLMTMISCCCCSDTINSVLHHPIRTMKSCKNKNSTEISVYRS